MSVESIQKQLDELEVQKQKLLKELEETKKLTPAQQLADILHSKQCRWNHEDGCGYYYESWSNPGNNRYEYLAKANAMLKDIDFETAVKVTKHM